MASQQFQPRVSAKQATVINSPYIYNLVTGPRKASKCVDGDTLIRTPDGLVPMRVVAGPLLPGHESENRSSICSFNMMSNKTETTQCDMAFRNSTTDAIAVITKSGYEVVCSEVHPLWCFKDGKHGFLLASEISTALNNGDEVWMPVIVGHNQWTSKVPISASVPLIDGVESTRRKADKKIALVIHGLPPNAANHTVMKASGATWYAVNRFRSGRMAKDSHFNFEITSDAAYLFGLLVGDGCMTDSKIKGHMIGYTTADPFLLSELRRIVSALFPDSGISAVRGSYGYDISSKLLRSVVVHLGMNKHSHLKSVPELILRSPKTVAASFLSGLFDTDGWSTKKGYVGYCSASEKLAKQVHQLLLALGVFSSLKFYKNSHKGAWKIDVIDRISFLKNVGFRLHRKTERVTHQSKGVDQTRYPSAIIKTLREIWSERGARGLIGKTTKRQQKEIHALFSRNVPMNKTRLDWFCEIMHAQNDVRLTPFRLNDCCVWERVRSAGKAKADLYDVSVPGYRNFIGAGVINHNSWGVLHAVAWHMWTTKDSVGIMLGQSTTQNLDAGLWPLLIDKIIPAWIEGHIYDSAGNVIDHQPFGMEWVTRPKMSSATHRQHFQVSNKFGGVSTFFLESLDVEDQVERFKNKILDLIVGTEFSNFKRRKTFDILKNCFRGRPLEECRMFLDQNPPEEGETSWSYLLFFWFRTVDLDTADPEVLTELGLDTVPNDKRPRMIKALKQLQSQLNVIEFNVADNEFISEEEKDSVYADHAHDPDLLARYFYGRYVRASGDGIFREVWRPDIHLIGEPKTPAHPNPETLVPEIDCIQLDTGSDIGRRNTAIVVVEKIKIEVQEKDKHGEKRTTLKTGFKFLDEYVSLGKQQKLSEIAEVFLRFHEFWGGLCKAPPLWRHISDNSAFAADLQSESDEAREIYRLTDGVIELESIVSPQRRGSKGHGAVDKSIDLVQRLLFEERIFISKSRCPNLAQMFGSIARAANGKLSPSNMQKHVLDAGRYLVMYHCWEELAREPRMRTTQDSGRLLVTTT